MKVHYFDYAASCPPFPEVLQEFNRVSVEYYGNPSSGHFLGREAHEALGMMKYRLVDLVELAGSLRILMN